MASNDFNPFGNPVDYYHYNIIEHDDGTAASFILLDPVPRKSLGTRIGECFAAFASRVYPERKEDPVIQTYSHKTEAGRVRFAKETETLYSYVEEGNRLAPITKLKNYGATEVSDEQIQHRLVDSEIKQQAATQWASLQHEINMIELERLNPWKLSYKEAQKTLEKLRSFQEQLSDPKFRNYSSRISDLIKQDQKKISRLMEEIPSALKDYENADKKVLTQIGRDRSPFQAVIVLSEKRNSYIVSKKRYSNLKIALNNFPFLSPESPVLVEVSQGMYRIYPRSLHSSVTGSTQSFETIRDACSTCSAYLTRHN